MVLIIIYKIICTTRQVLCWIFKDFSWLCMRADWSFVSAFVSFAVCLWEHGNFCSDFSLPVQVLWNSLNPPKQKVRSQCPNFCSVVLLGHNFLIHICFSFQYLLSQYRDCNLCPRMLLRMWGELHGISRLFNLHWIWRLPTSFFVKLLYHICQSLFTTFFFLAGYYILTFIIWYLILTTDWLLCTQT